MNANEGRELVRMLRLHRRDPRYFPLELAQHMSERMQAWRDDPTAQGLSFDAWLSAAPAEPPRLTPVALQVAQQYR